MHTVTSADGTRIAYERSGAGPPLLLVHGMVADHGTTWRSVREALERHFTVHALDRRGRGGSGDAPAYALQREAEDVAAVVEAIGGPVDVLGHSYGGLCALEAARSSPEMRRLLVYEGIPLRGTDVVGSGVPDLLEGMVAEGDVEGMLLAFMRDEVKMPLEEIELLRSQREAWASRVRNAPTVPRELRALESYVFDPERYSRMDTSTLLLVGEESPPTELGSARVVAAALPDADVVVLPGQRHLAMFTGSEAFVATIVRRLTS
jgi:pimeloyl-ACP methyl ester carboxylesterase